jgi:apolipoprotein N-acyltransferase
MNIRQYRLFLALIFGLMLGLAYPPVPTGITAAFAFVPFFLLFESIDKYGTGFRYSYLSFFIFNLITLYWAGGFAYCRDMYQMVAGILLLIAHPIFFSVPIMAWIFIRRQLGFKISVLMFPFLWVAFEYLHSLTEISFPWLILGNTQTYDLSIIQFASITGVYGVSFWLLLLNVLAFILFTKIYLKEWKPLTPFTLVTMFCILVIYFVPKYFGDRIIHNTQPVIGAIVQIAIIQPNIDPFEKWDERPEKSLDIIQQQTGKILYKGVDLILWPETAVPFYILHPANKLYLEKLKLQVNSINCNLLTGIPDIRYYKQTDDIPKTSKTSLAGEHYDTYNSSMLLQPKRDDIQKYAKIILVPFAERVPFSEALNILNAMQWNFGLGGWSHGKDTTVFQCMTQDGRKIKFSNMICYESVYPQLVSAFVRRGTQFLTVITNDSWWGNTSGAYQHKQIAVMRAIENRRWVVQCANGGISVFIDPYGNITQATNMYEQSTLFGSVQVIESQSFYTRYGDWLAEVALIISAFFLSAAISKKVYKKIRQKDSYEVH